MHSQLLHEALQKEETRAIVIEVDDGPEEPGEDEEFYAANFELLGQEDEDEVEGMVSEDEAPPLVSSEGEPDEEPLPYAHLGEDRPRLCQQRVPLEVNGNLAFLHTLYDWETPNTLVRIESARRIDLQGMRAPRQAIKGYQGVGTITDSVYYLPLMNTDGNVQVIRAHGGEEIAVVARTRLPHCEGDLPCHPSIHALDEDRCGTCGAAHRVRQQAVAACPRGGLMGPG
jgi:hypothetical protein